jgi:hypothetical protein
MSEYSNTVRVCTDMRRGRGGDGSSFFIGTLDTQRAS